MRKRRGKTYSKFPKKQQKKLKRIDNRENKRLGSSGVVRTKSFKYGQKTGKANAGRSLTEEEIEQYKIENNIL